MPVLQRRAKFISEAELQRASRVHIARLEAAVQKYAPRLWELASAHLIRWLRYVLSRLAARYPQYRADGDEMLTAILSQLSKGFSDPDLSPALRDMWRSSIEGYFLATDPRAQEIEEYTRRMIENDLGEYWKNLTDPGTLARKITKWREQGKGYEDVSRQLGMEVMAQDLEKQYRTGYYTAERLVRTTYNASANFVAMKQLQQQGYTHKQWITARDARVRGAGKVKSPYSHVFMEGKTVPIDDPFVTRENFRMMFPGDRSKGAPIGHVIHCRCTVIGIIQEGARPSRPTAQQPIQTPAPRPSRPTPAPPAPTPVPQPVFTPPPPPRPAPPQRPTPAPATPAATGPSIRSAIQNKERGNKTAQAIETAMSRIDQVHTFKSGSRPIPIRRASLGGSRQGAFSYTNKGRPVEIRIDPKAQHPDLTAVHEIGHYLDLEGFGSGRKVAASDPRLKEFRDAAMDSEAVRELRQMRYSPWLEVDGEQYETPVRHLTYLLDMDEIWARAYAQFIAEETGDPTLLMQIRDVITDDFGPVRYTQWTEADFAPIRAAIRKYLEVMGWLKKS
ncbi:hypothetical protein [Deinococcus cellulosilyticus]|uniref:Phage head morphogenesis domain-containing protein n=1 Tax=Deinococcus cellulosilyticus (strain DSM 18568 / NBRC 106333 / KACC 11606 / 5516J-15) TaxID=1223518 RepID=A0A511N2X7_DEIC1|nr:hypothetical protein [Deinococcus cellulosilyticus]GEM47203.1 hypothetical protein DC3_28380 [Deinococcus cellulosilyticus NBRC 106333 = KACC 11606]